MIATAKARSRFSPIINAEALEGLPEPVQRYLTFSGVIGKPWIDTVRLKYSGRFRTGADKPWMPLNVEQFYTTNPPGFLWKARFRMFGLPLMRATDVYKDGHGHMHGKILGLFTVADGKGDEVDQGTAIRFLNEMTWFPTAYLGDNITWSAVDNHAADVTLHDGPHHVSARMYFDDAGRLLNFIAERYGDFGGKYTMASWATPFTEYGTFGGLRIPIKGLGVWQLHSGDLSYVDVCLNEVEYNVPLEAF